MTNLDLPDRELKDAFDRIGEILREVYKQSSDRTVFPGVTPSRVREIFDEPLPEDAADLSQLLEKLRTDVVDTATNNIGPRFYGYITGGGNQVAVLAEAVRAALNQNNLKWHSSPVSSEMEKLVIRWLAEFIGYPTDCAGALLSGGSVANFECLAVARRAKAPTKVPEKGLYGSAPLTVYVSEEGHSSFDKAMDILGMGRKYLRKIPVDDDMRIIPDMLEQQIREDKKAGLNPVCAIGIAGTTNSGAVDDLKAVAEICKRHGLWYHVDAAYGGPAARVEMVTPHFEGLERADSVVINPHKWLYIPFEAGAALYKNPEQVRRTFSYIPDYLKAEGDGRIDQMEFNLPLTKGFKALKVWMTLKAFGAKRLCEAIRADIHKAQYLRKRIKDVEDLELTASGPLSIVCFRCIRQGWNEGKLNRFNQQLIEEIEADGRIFLTGTAISDKASLRVCFINHRSTLEDVDFLVDVVRELARQSRGKFG